MNPSIVIHYSEIGLKGKNRRHFEEALVRNIRRALGPLAAAVQNRYGRIVCTPAAEADPQELRRRLKRLPGIAHFSPGLTCGTELVDLEKTALAVLEGHAFETFGVKTKRSDKRYPLTSAEVSARIGAHVLREVGGKVDLTRPDLRLYVELTSREAFLYTEKVPGPGGLPVGTGGKVIASISGGIDSPVAAYLTMKRGCQVIFGHIRNETQFASGAVNKIERLVQELAGVQLRARLYIIPFGDLQRAIIATVPAKFRMIVYRRLMMRILGRIAGRERAKAIVTGDSLGQVASQTLDNLRCIQDAAELPVLSPLAGFNKEEIVAPAERIGTFEHSIEPYPDCCSFMIAAHPETHADLEEIRRCESFIPEVEALMDQAVDGAEVKEFSAQD